MADFAKTVTKISQPAITTIVRSDLSESSFFEPALNFAQPVYLIPTYPQGSSGGSGVVVPTSGQIYPLRTQ